LMCMKGKHYYPVSEHLRAYEREREELKGKR